MSVFEEEISTFRNSESTHPQFTNRAAKCLGFFVKKNSFNNIYLLRLRLQRKQEKNHEKKLWIRRFGIHENMS